METETRGSSGNIQTDEFLDVVADFMRYRRRMLNDLPEELLHQRERLVNLQIGLESKRNPDHDLFYKIGMVLNRHKEPLTMGELSKELDVPLSTATRIIDKLVESGFAERVADPEDRRVVRVTLTADGRDTYQVVYSFIRQRIGQIMSRFTDEERTQLVALLRKAAHILDEITG